MKLGELFFNVTFKADTMKLKDFGRAIADLNMASILGAAGLGGVYEAAKNIINGLTETGNNLNNFSRVTGQSTEELQRWSKAAKEVGVNADVIAGIVTQLQTNFANFAQTGEGLQAPSLWSRVLGMDLRHPMDQFKVLDRLYDFFSRFKDLGQRNSLMQRMGIPLDFGNIFSTPKAQFEQAMSSAQTFKPEDLKKVAEYQKDAADLSTDWNQTLNDIGITIIPIITAFKGMEDSLDHFIQKSEHWKLIMQDIANLVKEWSHPKQLMQKDKEAVKGLIWNFVGGANFMNEFRKLGNGIPSGSLFPHPLSAISNLLPNSQPQVHVVVKNTSNSPIETSVESSGSQGNITSKTIRQAVGQQPAGST